MDILPEAENFHYLENLIRRLSDGKQFHLCIYDLSGIHHGNPLLEIPEINRFHMAQFCQFVKTSPVGFRNCIKCKYFSIRRAQSSRQAYAAQCYMGVTEIVKPVYINNRLVSVIYLGNLYVGEQEGKTAGKMVKMAEKLGIQPDLLLEKWKCVQPVDIVEIQDYHAIVEILCHSIRFTYAGTPMDPEKPSHKSYPSRSHWIANTVTDFIMAHYQRDIRIEQIASLHSMNSNYMRNIFKKCTGMRFTDYIHRIRVKNAETLLKNTSLSIIDISTRVGFNNVTYFNKVFKQITGLPPTACRNISKQ